MKKVGFLFPGQGSQKQNMGKEFYDKYQYAKELYEQVSDELKIDFKKIIFNTGEGLDNTAITQPAIILTSAIILHAIRNELDIEPEFALGHSLGEYGAIMSSGAISDADTIKLVHIRGKMMQSIFSSGLEGGMLVSLGLKDEKIEELVNGYQQDNKKIWLANYNCDMQMVLAGIKSDLESVINDLKKNGAKRVMLLPMSISSHCPLLEPMKSNFASILEDNIEDNFDFPIVSNTTKEKYNTKERAIELLSRQLMEPVYYKQSIASVQEDIDLFVEIGPSNILKGLNNKISKEIVTMNTDSLDSMGKFIKEVK